MLWDLWRREYSTYSWWFKLQVLFGKRCVTFDEYKACAERAGEHFQKHSKKLIEKTSCPEAEMTGMLLDFLKALNDEELMRKLR